MALEGLKSILRVPAAVNKVREFPVRAEDRPAKKRPRKEKRKPKGTVDIRV